MGCWASPPEPSEGGLPLVGLVFRALGSGGQRPFRPCLRDEHTDEMQTPRLGRLCSIHPCSSPSCPKTSKPDPLVELFHYKESLAFLSPQILLPTYPNPRLTGTHPGNHTHTYPWALKESSFQTAMSQGRHIYHKGPYLMKNSVQFSSFQSLSPVQLFATP